jgi:Flp pilus assembly protein CpaB
MKRIRLLILLGAVAVALPLAVLSAGSAGATPAFADVSIEPNAQYDIQGSILHVELRAACNGGAGAVVVDVTQSPPETEYPVAFGSGPRSVVCDGTAHEVAVTIFGQGFDAGRAFATATLTVVDENATEVILAQDMAQRTIDIRVV